jgi:hypothetical protein
MQTVSAILESSWFFIFSQLGISFRVAQFDDEAQLSDAGGEMNCTDIEESGGQMDKEKNHSRKCFNACAKLAIACLVLLGTLGFLSSRPSFVFGHQSVPVRSMKSIERSKRSLEIPVEVTLMDEHGEVLAKWHWKEKAIGTVTHSNILVNWLDMKSNKTSRLMNYETLYNESRQKCTRQMGRSSDCV